MELRYKTLKSGAKTLDVTGLSTEKILSISPDQLKGLKQSDLRKLTSRLVSSANKRIRRIESAGAESPSLREVRESGGVFSVKSKNYNELQKEFARARRFFKSKTSTVAGAKRYTKKFEEFTKGLNEEQKKDFFNVLSKLRQTDRATYESHYKEFVEKNRELTKNSSLDSDDVYNILKKKLDAYYEEEQEDAPNDISTFFT